MMYITLTEKGATPAQRNDELWKKIITNATCVARTDRLLLILLLSSTLNAITAVTRRLDELVCLQVEIKKTCAK